MPDEEPVRVWLGPPGKLRQTGRQLEAAQLLLAYCQVRGPSPVTIALDTAFLTMQGRAGRALGRARGADGAAGRV